MFTYIAGGMTGYPDFNHPAFNAKAAELRAQGVDVINPAEHDAEIGLDQPWATYLRRDLALLAEFCDTMVMLDGWGKSKGACLEHHVARALGFTIHYPNGQLFRDGELFAAHEVEQLDIPEWAKV